jgi:putative SOS response-associated peptidase YedK
MCGRFALFSPADIVARHFGLDETSALVPRHNLAPSQPVYIIRQQVDGRRVLGMADWGLIPAWSAEPKCGFSTFNARAETVATKPAFRQAFQLRRCLIPADGYYEWHTQGRQKQPYFIYRQDRSPFAFAGLWERWERGGPVLESCTIIVTGANARTRAIHDRMPVILAPEDYSRWLLPASAESAQALLVPCASDCLAYHAVADFVGNPRNDDPRCMQAAKVSVNESLWGEAIQ